jgi:heme-degrading monooxygenase HmoA
MYARSTTIQADPQQMDAGITVVRDEVMPVMTTMPGFVGLSMLCDRMSGRCIVTSSWDSEESMHASESAVHELRRRAADAMDGAQPEVAEWEIAMMHRVHGAHDGCVTRVVWGESDPARADDNLQTMRMAAVPKMEELPGFCAMSLFVNRESGRSAMATTYDHGDPPGDHRGHRRPGHRHRRVRPGGAPPPRTRDGLTGRATSALSHGCAKPCESADVVGVSSPRAPSGAAPRRGRCRLRRRSRSTG